MTEARKQVPSWGVFREITTRCAEPLREDASEALSAAPAPAQHVSPSLPVFDTLTAPEMQDDQFYARQAEFRDEEEFDELGEGAFRQIGRNLAHVAGSVSAAACLALAVMWMVPSANDTTMIAQSATETTIDTTPEKATAIALKEQPGDAPAPEEQMSFIEIDVELPIPSVIAKADPNSTALQSTLHADAGYPSPTPLPRSIAMASMELFEEGRLAEGSDDEALSAAREPKTWVSVMIPKTRPSF